MTVVMAKYLYTKEWVAKLLHHLSCFTRAPMSLSSLTWSSAWREDGLAGESLRVLWYSLLETFAGVIGIFVFFFE
jgi:hypothetical protein